MAHNPQHFGLSSGRDFQRAFGDYDLRIGQAHFDFFSGSDAMDVQFGRANADILLGNAQNDDLLGGRGSDVLVGGAGMDHIDGGKGNDLLIGGDAADGLRGADGRDYLSEGVGHGDLEGGAGNDVLSGGLGGDAFIVDPTSGHDIVVDFQAGPGILDHIAFREITPEELTFQDPAAGVKISWADGEGSVLLAGIEKADLAQDDFMFADDRYLLQPTSADADHVSAVSFAKDEGFNVFAPDITDSTTPATTIHFDEFNVQIGAAQADALAGTDARDFYFGLGGDDRLSGAAEDDNLTGDAGNDTLDGGMGQDHLVGGAGDDQLFGGDQADNLMGEDGKDTLYAGAGHDMLEGGGGDDVLNGGDGADAFIVSPDSGNDVVTGGFDAGPGAFDHIAFRDITPDEVTVADTTGGVLVSWTTDQGTGSLLLEGLTKSEMAQDDFMFNADAGTSGAFVNDPAITDEGSLYLFRDGTTTTDVQQDYLLA